MIGLAKREEEIVLKKDSSSELSATNQEIISRAKEKGAKVQESEDYILIELPKNAPSVMFLQRIRDESHRFAVSYHSTLKRVRQTRSLLEELPGIGPATRKKLLRTFGSVRGVKVAPLRELEALLGPSKAQQVHGYLNSEVRS